MADSLQKRLLRMNSEILSLKTSQTKPSAIIPYHMRSGTVQSMSTHTIYFKDGGENYAPIIRNETSVLLLPFNASNNSQQFISTYSSETTVLIMSSREIDRIV